MIFYAPLEALIVMLLTLPILIKAIQRRKRGTQLIAAIVFMAYITIAAKYFFFPIMFDTASFQASGINLELVPILPLVEQAKNMGTVFFCKQVCGNVLAFVPITFLGAMNYKTLRTLKDCTIFAVTISCGIELIQLIINLVTTIPNRAVSINDVVLNSLGGMLGYLCWATILHV